MRKVDGILISLLRKLKLGNIKYLFKVIQLVRTASGFKPRSSEETCLESKWEIKR